MEFQTETASLGRGTRSGNETAYLVCKRAFDIVVSFCALVVLSPVFLIICLIIYLDDPHGSPLFSQMRIGKTEKHSDSINFAAWWSMQKICSLDFKIKMK